MSLDIILQEKEYWLECLREDTIMLDEYQHTPSQINIELCSEKELINIAKNQDCGAMDWPHEATIGAIEALNRVINRLQGAE